MGLRSKCPVKCNTFPLDNFRLSKTLQLNDFYYVFIATVDLELLNCEKLERIREYVKQHGVQTGKESNLMNNIMIVIFLSMFRYGNFFIIIKGQI